MNLLEFLNKKRGDTLDASEWNQLVSATNTLIDTYNDIPDRVSESVDEALLEVIESGAITGPKGDKGDTGPLGQPGPLGPLGPLGEKGDAGLKGAKGDTGPLGEQGPKGDPFVYTDFTAEQLASLTGPTGPQGPKGDKGDKGDQGIQGIQGEQGPAGQNGTNGQDGITPHIDPTTKHWMIGETDTGVVAESDINIDIDLNEDAWKTLINTNGNTYVDLGLPSGTLWLSSTIGNNLKSTYQNYVDTTSNNPILTAELWLISVNSVNTGTLAFNILTGEPCIKGLTVEYGQPIDDIVKTKLGGDWTTPTLEDFIELFSNTTIETFSINDSIGLIGYKCVNKKDPKKYIIIDSYAMYYKEDYYNTYNNRYSLTGAGTPAIYSCIVGFNKGYISIIRTTDFNYKYTYGLEEGYSFLGIIKKPSDYNCIKKVAITGNYFDLKRIPNITKYIYNENIDFYNLNGHSSNFLTSRCLWANTVLTEEISGVNKSIFTYEFYSPSTSILLSTPSWGGDWQLPSLDDLLELMNYCYPEVAKNNNLEDVINLISKDNNTLIVSLPVTNNPIAGVYITRIISKYNPITNAAQLSDDPCIEIICDVDTWFYFLNEDRYYGAPVVILPVIKNNISKVGLTGSYNDLTDKPTIPAAQVQSDWNASSGIGEILNKPSLATVAITGAYSDLTGTPTILTVPGNEAAANGGTDLSVVTTGEKYTWNNKSDFSGDYNDLSNKPTIPAALILADWNQTNSTALDYIKNKPTIDLSGYAKIWNGTQAQYNALTTKDSNTIYIIS